MQIVNKRNHRPTPNDVYVGRPSPLGNPFRMGTNSRAQVIRAYKHWLYEAMQGPGENSVMEALSRLTEDSVLVCWCAPLPCHAEVIRDAWRWARKEGLL